MLAELHACAAEPVRQPFRRVCCCWHGRNPMGSVLRHWRVGQQHAAQRGVRTRDHLRAPQQHGHRALCMGPAASGSMGQHARGSAHTLHLPPACLHHTERCNRALSPHLHSQACFHRQHSSSGRAGHVGQRCVGIKEGFQMRAWREQGAAVVWREGGVLGLEAERFVLALAWLAVVQAQCSAARALMGPQVQALLATAGQHQVWRTQRKAGCSA